MSYTLLRASDRSLAGTGLRHTSGRIVNGLSESKFSFGDGGETFTISEISDYEEGCGIGRNIWEASVALSCFLASYSESMGRTLEIGAGVGLVGHSIASNSSKVRVSEERGERSDELRRRVYWTATFTANTSVRGIAAANFCAVSNITNDPSIATRFARHRLASS